MNETWLRTGYSCKCFENVHAMYTEFWEPVDMDGVGQLNEAVWKPLGVPRTLGSNGRLGNPRAHKGTQEITWDPRSKKYPWARPGPRIQERAL